jgi:photosystem II stability/assembly factor-like uncharacterized protein
MGGTGNIGGTGNAPPSAWVNATSNLANMQSECGNLTMLSAKPGAKTVFAGVAKHGLFASEDGGKSWQPTGTGAGSAMITNRPSSVVYDPQHPEVFWESGIYNGGGVYRSDDAGKTFVQLGNAAHNDLVTVDFTDPMRQTLLAGSHETKRKLLLSKNGGQAWMDIGMNLPADSHFSSAPLIIDTRTFLLGACGYGMGACGVYRSTDGGTTWMRTTDLATTGEPLVASSGAIYWTLIYDSGLARSTDKGQTWMKIQNSFVQVKPVELPGGKLAGVIGDHLQVSTDGGMTWKPIGDKVPWKPQSLAYSAALKTFFISHWDCNNVVLSDAIMSAGYDYALP